MMRHCLYFVLFLFPIILWAQHKEKDSPEGGAYALLIGIDRYKTISPKFWLEGCKNDLDLFSCLLQERFGFKKENMTLLQDEEATRENILQAFHALVEKAKKGGKGTRVVFFYSGHGSQKVDQEGEEEDGLDETLVAYDSDLEEGINDILDDEVDALLLERLRQAQAYTTVIYDCCHSGTGDRSNRKSRSLERKLPVPKKKLDLQIYRKETPPNTVFIAACKPYEEEFEYYSKENRKVYGMLTYHIAKAIQQEKGESILWKSVFQKIADFYKTMPQSPSPSIVGNSLQEVFGMKSCSLPKCIKVKEIFVEKNLVKLDGGALRCITQGSIFCLLPRAEDIPQEGQLKEKHILVTLDTIESFHSIARVLTKEERKPFQETIHDCFLEDSGSLSDVEAGWDAVEISHNYGDLKLNLHLEQEMISEKGKDNPFSQKFLPQPLQDVLTELSEKKVIQITEKIQEAHAILRIGQKKTTIVWAEAGQEIALQSQQETTGYGSIMIEEEEKKAESLRQTLIQINKVRNLITMTFPEDGLQVKANLTKIQKIGFGWASTGEIIRSLDEQSILPVLREKSQFGIQLTNDSEYRVYPTVLYITKNMGVKVIFPHRGASSSVPPGQKALLLPLQSEDCASHARKIFKIIVTTIPYDFQEIEMLDLSQARTQEKRPIERTSIGNFIFQSIFWQKRFGLVGHVPVRKLFLLRDEPQLTILTVAWQTEGKSYYHQ
ncbi:MAG: caspase family protein [Candidatus Brocadiae bacterium]|nr:caspase family protein [Candidatus Brocadiia bacterium]